MSLRQWIRNLNHPLRGLDADEQYREIQWGNEPDRDLIVDARHMRVRQKLVQLGWLRRVFVQLPGGRIRVIAAKRPYPFLTFGARDNRLYPVGGSLPAMARAHAFGAPGANGHVIRTDYESRKGQSSGTTYYYHDHEPEFAVLYVHRDGWPEYVGGDYQVLPEGITG